MRASARALRVARSAWWASVILLALAGGLSCSARGGGASPARPEVCDVVSFPYEEMMVQEGDSFRDLLDVRPAAGNQGTPAALLLLRGDADLGPYEPVVDFLADRYRAWDPSQGGGEDPPLTDAVRASANRLDADLAGGLCS